MMGTLLLLGGMLMMLTPATAFYSGLDATSMGQTFRRLYNPDPELPADMLEQLRRLD